MRLARWLPGLWVIGGMTLGVATHHAWANTPPVPPTLDPYPQVTNASGLWFSGGRPAYTEVWVNGSRAVISSSSTTWSYYKSLAVGNNTLNWSTKNAQGLQSTTVTISVLRDSTVPTTPVVTDDGVITTDGASLHATWQTSDASSGVNSCEVKIGIGAGSGSIMSATNVGDVREYTKTRLSLKHNWSYYFSVRTKDNAGNWSSWGYSDGIKYDAHLPAITSWTPAQGIFCYIGDPVSFTTMASDADNDALSYRYLVDGVQVKAWSGITTYTWTPQAAQLGRRVIRVEVKDSPGAVVSQEHGVYVVRKPVAPPSP